jgi:hypothetical protein
VAAEARGEFVLTDEGGLIADAPGQLTAFRRTGQVIWRAACGEVQGMPVAREALVVIATDQPAGLSVLDRQTGRTLWSLPLDAAPTTAPLVRKNTLYVGTPTGVVARSLVDGQPLWDAPAGRPGAPLVLMKNRLAFTTTEGKLIILAIEDGRVEQTMEGALPGFPPLASLDMFVYAGKGGLMVCPAAGGDPQTWMKIDWLGRLTSAPVMAESRLYIATDKKGLVCLKNK